MIIGTGIDIVDLSRMERAFERWGEGFARRILTGREAACLEERKNSAAYLGSRFAAKEAFLKALGTGYTRGISWHDMEVVRNDGERPTLSITGRAREIMEDMGVEHIHLSMSHERLFAVAQVILESA